MPKHRRPSRFARLGTRGSTPLHLGIAAGVAGTVAVTGTVVASATPTARSVSQGSVVSAAAFYPDRAVVQRRLRDAAAQAAAAARARAEAEARAKAKAAAEARRIAERKRAAAAAKKRAAKKAAEKRAAARRAAEARAAKAASRSAARASGSAGGVLSVAAAQSGDSYSYGGVGPDYFDCSGFTMYVFGQVGISLPHSSSAQRSMVSYVSSPVPGDLVFVHNGGGGGVSHVAIYAGGGYWYEASNPSQPVGRHAAWSSNVSYGRVL